MLISLKNHSPSWLSVQTSSSTCLSSSGMQVIILLCPSTQKGKSEAVLVYNSVCFRRTTLFIKVEMKFYVVVICCLAAVCLANGDDNGHCYASVSSVCGSVTGKNVAFNCNARYAGVGNVMNHLQSYAQTHIAQSFQYLLMSAYFGNYEVNRDGFSKLYRKLSDSTWEKSIKLIKYMGHRGYKMNFNAPLDANYTQFQLSESEYNLHELSSLGIALDMEKVLAEKADRIHADTSSKHSYEYHDAETVNFLEKGFIHEHSEVIRELSGHANDVQRLIKGGGTDPSLAIYMFDEYLQKIVT